MATRKQLKAAILVKRAAKKLRKQTLAAEGGNTSLPTRNAHETG